MDSKYYIPDVEELHPFIELYVDGKKQILDTEDTIQLYSRNFEKVKIKGDVKIKYLDRGDIERLGWTYNESFDNYHRQKDEESGWTLSFCDNKILINNTGDCIFYGTVKNKSELRRIMKQIKIL